MTDIEPEITTSRVADLLGYPIGTSLVRCTQDPLLLRSNCYLAYHREWGWSVAAVDEAFPADTCRYATAGESGPWSMVKTVADATWWPDLPAAARGLSARLHGVLATIFDLLVKHDSTTAVTEWMQFARTHPEHARQVADLFGWA